jgi:hypothetical protein
MYAKMHSQVQVMYSVNPVWIERSMIKHDNIIEQSKEEEDKINEKRP